MPGVLTVLESWCSSKIKLWRPIVNWTSFRERDVFIVIVVVVSLNRCHPFILHRFIRDSFIDSFSDVLTTSWWSTNSTYYHLLLITERLPPASSSAASAGTLQSPRLYVITIMLVQHIMQISTIVFDIDLGFKTLKPMCRGMAQQSLNWYNATVQAASTRNTVKTVTFTRASLGRRAHLDIFLHCSRSSGLNHHLSCA
jgi:hypothetical protein